MVGIDTGALFLLFTFCTGQNRYKSEKHNVTIYRVEHKHKHRTRAYRWVFAYHLNALKRYDSLNMHIMRFYTCDELFASLTPYFIIFTVRCRQRP